jgi:hypothetical protein
MHLMLLPPSSPSEPRRLAPALGAGRAAPRASRARTLCAGALALLAAVILPSAAARAQTLPQGYTSDVAAAPTETDPSQTRQVQDFGDDGADAQDPAAADDEYADTDPSALTEFQQPLAAHGTWVDDPTYGTVWVPAADAVGPDFAPYVSGGHWAMTDDGEWLWVSDYEWGYIPFHYGRWIWIPAYGWSWIPGRVYAPAWVVWRTGDYGYIGWAPMPPAYYWSSGVAVSFWVVPTAAYVFCPTTYVFHEHVTTYVVHDRTTVHRVAAHTHPYRPARPTGGSPAGAHRGASPSGGGARLHYRPASPSLAEAHVPSSEAPKSKAAADARALAYARKSTTPSARAMSPGARGLHASPNPRGPARGSRAALPSPSARAPGARPRLPDAAGGRSPGDFDRSARTPRTPAPVIRTPSPRGDTAPQPMPRAPHITPSPRAPSTPHITPAPRAPSHVSRPITIPRAPSASPRPSVPSGGGHRSTPAPAPAAPKIHRKK